MAEQEEIARLRTKVAHLEFQLKILEEHHAGCDCITRTHPNLIESARISSTSFSNVQRISESLVSRASPAPASPASPSFKTIRYVHEIETLPRKKRRPEDSFGGRPKRCRSDVAGQQFIGCVKGGEYAKMLRTPDVESIELDGTAYQRGEKIAARTGGILHNATYAEHHARLGLFYFLSSLVVLEGLGRLSEPEVDRLMELLEGKPNTYYHRRAILRGATWFHQEVISAAYNQGWELGHAIAVVALNAPRRGYLYDDISSWKKKEGAIEAVQSVRDSTEHLKHYGLFFFDYIRLWQPLVSDDEIFRLLYPNVSSPIWPVQNQGRLVLSTVPDILRIHTANPTRLLRPKPTTTGETDKTWAFGVADIACVHMTFGDYVSDPLKRRPVWFSEITKTGTHHLTNLVKTKIPRDNFQDAIISIEISTTAELVKTMFPQMKDIAVLPSSEEVGDEAVRVQTLKGVSVSKLSSVFPPSICDALDTSQLRTWEKQHLHLESTDCVTIEFRRKEPQHGTIRLRVGYHHSFDIVAVLYAEPVTAVGIT